MKSNLASPSSPIPHVAGEAGVAEVIPVGAHRGQIGRSRTAQAFAPGAPGSDSVWRHRLILTGTLDRGTAVELEDEIDCLCEEGVAALTLDLHQLDSIDSAGARTVASRGAGCRRHGLDFTVIAGGPRIQRALAEAGAEGLVADGPVEGTGVVRLRVHPVQGSPRETSTVMVKSL
ncbi:MAG TPA: STAS domain-containing protein [Solirubrobacteraceae bacterium]|nr:STAS domain-containing protein [Solirubrobacteraceae bacterium]